MIVKFNAAAIFGLLLGEEQVLAFFESLRNYASCFYNSKPWKLIPGPWSVGLSCESSFGIMERFAAINYWLLKCKTAGHHNVNRTGYSEFERYQIVFILKPGVIFFPPNEQAIFKLMNPLHISLSNYFSGAETNDQKGLVSNLILL